MIGRVKFILKNLDKSVEATRLCIIPITRGKAKTTNICLLIEFFISLFVTPIFLRILYLPLSSFASDSCLKNIILPVAAKNNSPKKAVINIISP
jgi:hypothetical protein